MLSFIFANKNKYNMDKIELLHGDCLEEMDKLISEGIKVDAIICDPPYGSTACSWDSVIPFDKNEFILYD